MPSMLRVVGFLSLAVLVPFSRASSPQPPGRLEDPLRTVADVPMPGPAVRFDYQSLDADQGRLYISHMNADQLIVFDTMARKVIANLDGFARVHGVWLVPELGRLYAPVTGEHQVAVVDTKTLHTVAKVGPINYPDGIAFAPGPQRVFVSDEHGDTDAVIDAQTNTLITSIKLMGGAGNTVYDPASGHILVAVHEANELVSIDPISLQIIEHYALSEVKRPHGVALDPENRLAFVAGQGNHLLALLDLASKKVVGTYPAGENPDVLAFDPGLKQLYVSAESGTVWVYRENGKALSPMGTFFMPHAHTVCVDPKTHMVYFPLENVDGRPLLRIMVPVNIASKGPRIPATTA